jgi:type III pantothenate kinase
MPNLVIDIGNSRIKSAIFKKNELIQEQVFYDLEEGIKFWAEHDFVHCLVSSVRFSNEELLHILPFKFRFLTSKTSLPISNHYGNPGSLGVDRLAAAVGGWKLAGKGPVLIIDLGTCLTIEFVNQQNVYIGGSISPGLSMRAKAMNTFTAQLPLIELEKKPEFKTGSTTISCMQVGIWQGMEYEITGQIQSYQKEFPEINVFVCGGDAQSFVSLAKGHIFVVPNLVLHGLNCILNHNVE